MLIRKLIEGGIGLLSRGGAEIFREPTRSMICAHKCDANRWLELVGKVHAAGFENQCNDALRAHRINRRSSRPSDQNFVSNRKNLAAFSASLPLAFYPAETQLSHLPGPSGVDSLKTMAVSRLLLDNFDHVKAYWVMLGKRLAQVALHYGRMI